MSVQAHLSRLPDPVRDLVLAVSKSAEEYGKSEKDKAEVFDWLSKVAQGDIAKPSAAKVHPKDLSY